MPDKEKKEKPNSTLIWIYRSIIGVFVSLYLIVQVDQWNRVRTIEENSNYNRNMWERFDEKASNFKSNCDKREIYVDKKLKEYDDKWDVNDKEHSQFVNVNNYTFSNVINKGININK